MHVRRIVGSAIVAVTLAVTLITATGWNPICAIYNPSDPEYWLFFCWVDEPPKDPRT